MTPCVNDGPAVGSGTEGALDDEMTSGTRLGVVDGSSDERDSGTDGAFDEETLSGTELGETEGIDELSDTSLSEGIPVGVVGSVSGSCGSGLLLGLSDDSMMST